MADLNNKKDPSGFDQIFFGIGGMDQKTFDNLKDKDAAVLARQMPKYGQAMDVFDKNGNRLSFDQLYFSIGGLDKKIFANLDQKTGAAIGREMVDYKTGTAGKGAFKTADDMFLGIGGLDMKLFNALQQKSGAAIGAEMLDYDQAMKVSGRTGKLQTVDDRYFGIGGVSQELFKELLLKSGTEIGIEMAKRVWVWFTLPLPSGPWLPPRMTMPFPLGEGPM